ncbi:MAG TPA: xanthine dehydrogenase family protein molybdopterin-binding subunit [Elusimicrobiota bacterium]|nr:xanthine dehydrogenase family protein molybdopterin-binding subunit [Elusimicrobiota bacterium]
MALMANVGKSVLRREGPEKLTGRALYLDDHAIPGCWHGVTVRSTIPSGRVKAVRFDPSFPWKECAIVTARDIPGKNVVTLIEPDQPLLADGVVRHREEPILLIAHPDRATAYEAAKRVTVEYEPLPAALTLEDSLALKNKIFKDDNVFKSYLIEKGDLAAGFAQADFVVEGEYRSPAQEQAYIENNAIAAWEEDGVMVVSGSLQCPYYVVKALKALLGRDETKVRVIQTVTGGGFGGKEEYPSMIAGHAALLALKAGRPVKIVYDRHEDMAATTKRHPCVVRQKVGLKKDGTLVAQDIDVLMDGGAYATLSSVVLSRGTLHAAGAYTCPNVRVRSRAMATNTPPNGAFRGFGAPQTLFAAELHWEKIADVLGIDSLTLKRKNLFQLGSVTATGQILRESVGAQECLDVVLKRSKYAAKRKEYDRWNKDRGNPTWRGIGLAIAHHGAGFTGSGEVYLASRAGVAITRDAKIFVLAASTEIGQGTNTMFAQVAADAIGVPFDWLTVETPDTHKVPDSGPTVASRTCMVVGGLVRRAALQLKAALEAEHGRVPKTPSDLKKAAATLCAGKAARRFEVEYEKPPEVNWDDKTYMGDAYGCYSYAAFAADLEIDKATYEVRVRKVTTAQDVGKALNPTLCEGQIIGGSTQGLGWALLEEPVYKDGVMINAQLTNYIIPTSLDTPPFDVTIVERPYSRGPFGAKGVGELPMDVPAPAVAAAIKHATGRLMTVFPFTPERIAEALS